MRVVCVSRHRYLSEHLCRFFEQAGIATVPSVGIDEAIALVPAADPDAVICEYDLLATIPLARWEQNADLADVPIIAVSLTRHPGEAHLLDVNGIAGFLYLPTLDPEDARRVLAAARRKRGGIMPPAVPPWPGSTPVTQPR